MWKWLNHGANRYESVVRLDLPQRQRSSARSLQWERTTTCHATRARRSDHERRIPNRGASPKRGMLSATLKALHLTVRAVAVQRLSVAISKRSHPIPFRTRKLSSSEPMVLLGRLSGRVGRRRDLLQARSADALRASFFSGTPTDAVVAVFHAANAVVAVFPPAYGQSAA